MRTIICKGVFVQSLLHSVDFADSLSSTINNDSNNHHENKNTVQSSSDNQSPLSSGDDLKLNLEENKLNSDGESDRLSVSGNHSHDVTTTAPSRRKAKWKRDQSRKTSSSSSGDSRSARTRKEISSSSSSSQQSILGYNKNEERQERLSKSSSLSEHSPDRVHFITKEDQQVDEHQPLESITNTSKDGNSGEDNGKAIEGSPRYGKRFRFSKRFVRMQKLEASNETYYPPDHIRDGNLWAIKKELHSREQKVVESLRAEIRPFIPRYVNLSHYLDLSYQLKQSITQEELQKLKSIQDGNARSKYRAQLNGRIQEEQRRKDRALAKQRKKMLMKETVMVEYVRENEQASGRDDLHGGNKEGKQDAHQYQQSIWVCEGCSFKEKMFDYAVKKGKMSNSADGTILRKFVGNREVDEIFTNDHGMWSMDEGRWVNISILWK